MNNNRVISFYDGNLQKRTGSYVLYWMQQSQRVHKNHALSFAIEKANAYQLPLVVYFGLTANYPDANQRHYQFMLEGLKEVKGLLEKLHIHVVIRYGQPEIMLRSLLSDARYLVMDQGYLKHQIAWRNDVWHYVKEHESDLTIKIIDTDLIVPVHITSQKAEYGAYTIRPKLKKLVKQYLDFDRLPNISNTSHIDLQSDDDLSDLAKTIKNLGVSDQVLPSTHYHGGYIEASKWFTLFLMQKGNHYLESNDPSKDLTSKMSMYLHFGQISSLDLLERVLFAMQQNTIDEANGDAFIEQLLVRRELAFNYVYYTKGYDQFETMTEPWAYQTMQDHHNDQRHIIYDQHTIETYQTHDPYFNAAMKEMVITGYMHNYMRMYWAKKIIEWTPTHKEAYEMIKTLNNKYFIDGRDANSYAGVAWCFGKHDRPWQERAIFGKLRYMNASGLERKYDIQDYVNKMNALN